MTTVSVIIPSYNHGHFLRDTVASVLAEQDVDLELIVIDDGSRDDSWAILQELAATDARLRIYTQSNQGAHATINRGLALARGQFLSILNSDDRYVPGRLSQLAHYAQTHQLDFICTGLRLINEHNKPITDTPWLLEYERMVRRAKSDGVWMALLERNITISTSNFFLSRSLYQQLGDLHPYRFNMDWDYALRAYMANPTGFAWLPDWVLWEYRWHGNNTIANALPLAAVEANHLLQRVLSQHYGVPSTLLASLRRHHKLIRQKTVADAVTLTVDQTLASIPPPPPIPSCWERFKHKVSNWFKPAPPPVIEPEPEPEPAPPRPLLSIAVHVHVYYVDLLDELLDAVAHVPGTPAVFISTPHPIESIQAQVLARFPLATVWQCANQGKDIGPFVDALHRFNLDDYDLVLKLHGKKSLNDPSYMKVIRQLFGQDLVDGDAWRRALIAPLAGSQSIAQAIVDDFYVNPQLGMVGAARFLTHAPDADPAAYARICDRLHIEHTPTFFAGTMFWIQGAVLRDIKEANIRLDSFKPTGPNQVENTLEHQMERVFGGLVKKHGLEIKGV